MEKDSTQNKSIVAGIIFGLGSSAIAGHESGLAVGFGTFLVVSVIASLFAYLMAQIIDE